jgi:formylmethanofuran dehydrogenase subunit E
MFDNLFDLAYLYDQDEVENKDAFNFDFVVDLQKTKKSNGCTCKSCNEIYPYDEPNQKDGTFKCYSCRTWG